jgi:serine/threonine-protein kinase
LAAAVAVLLVVGLVAWLASRTGTSGTGGGSGPSATTSTSSTPSSSPARTRSASESATPQVPQVTVNRGDYVGRPFEEARKDLEGLGLKVSEHRVDNPGDQQANTVAEVDPTGTVEKGSIITLSVYGEPVPTPTTTPTSTSSPPVTPSASTTPPGQTKSGKPSKSPKAKGARAVGKQKHGEGGAKH